MHLAGILAKFGCYNMNRPYMSHLSVVIGFLKTPWKRLLTLLTDSEVKSRAGFKPD